MTAETVMSIGQHALWILIIMSAPLLLSALLVGLIVGIFQAATQINEMTLSFIPKLLVLVIALVIAGPWLLQTMTSYSRTLILSIPGLIG